MRDNQGNSRQFGFVSYKFPHQAAQAMQMMNRFKLQDKPISVALHEPKMLRQEKLAAKFAAAANNGWVSHPEKNEQGALSSTGAVGMEDNKPKKLTRKQSNSYFRAAMEADIRGETYSVAQLASLSPSVRNEVLAGLLARRLKDLPGFDQVAVEEGVYHQGSTEEQEQEAPTGRAALLLAQGHRNQRQEEGTNWTDDEVHEVVEQLVAKLSLAQAVDALQNPASLLGHALHEGQGQGDGATASDLDRSSPGTLQTTASAELLRNLTTTTTSVDTSTTSLDPTLKTTTIEGKEDKLRKAVKELLVPTSAPATLDEIVGLLSSLPKKERAMSLFNRDFLLQKVGEAQEILALSSSDDDVLNDPALVAPTAPPKEQQESPKQPTMDDYLKTVATLSAAEAVSKLQAGDLAPLIAPASDQAWATTEHFISAFVSLPPIEAKQKLGDRVFKVIKAGGIKGAPKLTVALLDSQDLPALAHLADSFPEVLREMALRLK